MSIDRGNVRGLMRAIAYDAKGRRVGRVAQVFLADGSDEPAWAAVDVTRTRGMRLLPLVGAAIKGRSLVVRTDRATIRSAPRVDLSEGMLSSHEESRLLEHYGLGGGPRGIFDGTTSSDTDHGLSFSRWSDQPQPHEGAPQTAPLPSQPSQTAPQEATPYWGTPPQTETSQPAGSPPAADGPTRWSDPVRPQDGSAAASQQTR